MPRHKKFPVKQHYRGHGWTRMTVDALLLLHGASLRATLCTNEDREECSRSCKCYFSGTAAGSRADFERCRKVSVMVDQVIDIKEI